MTANIATVVDNRLATLKWELVDKQGDSSAAASKKLNLTEQSVLKSDGNKQQFKQHKIRRINLLLIEPPLDQQQVNPTDFPSDEEVLQLEEFNSDKCDFTFDSVQGAIIKEGALLNDGVQGNLKPCLQFWQNMLQFPKFVCNVIQHYVLPFKAIPPRIFLLNNRSALRHSEFVEQLICKLVDVRCLIECESPPTVVNPLSVVQGKKLRLLLDLRHVNPHIQITKFRSEDLRLLSENFEPGFYFFTFDLES